MNANAEIRGVFFEECLEELERLEGTLAAFAEGRPDEETIGTAYRAVHSIKGGAASFHLNDLTAFARSFEAVLGAVRAGTLDCDARLAELLTDAARALGAQVEAARLGAPLLDRFRLVLPREDDAAAEHGEGGVGEELDLAALGFTPVAVDTGAIFDLGTGPAHLRILFAPRPSLYANANEAALLLREVLSLGEGQVRCIADAVAPLETLDPEGAALSFEIELRTQAGEDALRDIFAFVEDDCTLSIERLDASASEAPGEDVLSALLAAARA